MTEKEVIKTYGNRIPICSEEKKFYNENICTICNKYIPSGLIKSFPYLLGRGDTLYCSDCHEIAIKEFNNVLIQLKKNRNIKYEDIKSCFKCKHHYEENGVMDLGEYGYRRFYKNSIEHHCKKVKHCHDYPAYANNCEYYKIIDLT